MKFLLLCCLVFLALITSAHAVAGEPESLEARAHALMKLDPPDWQGARTAFEAAAEQGSMQAASYLGWMYENGHGVAQDHQTAAAWYQRVAEHGMHDYAVKLGWMHLGSSQLPRNREQAEFWFGKAIDAGYLPANIALASVLIADAVGGLGHERMDESRELLEQALSGELPLAALFLARLYVEGIGGHPVDDALGAYYTRISAEDGQALMQGWLARMYVEGRGVARDPIEAAFWASVAAAGGDPLGQQIHESVLPSLSDAERQAVMLRSMRWVFENQAR